MISVSKLSILTIVAFISSSLRHRNDVTTVAAAASSTSSPSSYTTTTNNNNNNNNSDDALRLLRDVIDTYDNRLRPVRNQSKPVHVYATFNLLNLREIDEISQRIALNVWVNFSWWDEIRTWNPEDYGGNDVIHPRPTDIWRPRTVLVNAADERDTFGDVHAPLSIYHTGATRWYVGGLYYFVCIMELTKFPFDEQTCAARVLSTDLGEEIDIVAEGDQPRMRDFLESGEWQLTSSGVRSYKFQELSGETLAFLEVSVTFQRLSTFYIINILIPIMCLSVLSLFSFVVPKDSGERCSYAMTVLLSLSFFLVTVSSSIPPNSTSFPILGFYIFSLISLSMLTVIIIVCQQRMFSYCSGGGGSSSGSSSDSETSSLSSNNDENQQSVFKTSMKSHHGFTSNKIQDGNKLYASNRVAPMLEDPQIILSNPSAASNKNFKAKEVKLVADNNNYHYKDTTGSKKSFWHSPLANRIKNILWQHDDVFCLVVFTTLWSITTIAFLWHIVGNP